MAATTSVSINLLIDTKKNKVLFAEAGKDFVDFLFNLLTLPAGTVICLLKKENMVGSLGKLYESVESLGLTYMLPDIDKNSLLKPHVTSLSSHSSGLPLLLGDNQVSRPKLFRCNGEDPRRVCRIYVTGDSTSKCPDCGIPMSNAALWVDKKSQCVGSASENMVGYVRGVVPYMVMDDLVVKPMSSSLVLNKVTSVKEVGALEEKVVELNTTEGLKLLKESLLSEKVLTNVFLGESSAYVLPQSFKRITAYDLI